MVPGQRPPARQGVLRHPDHGAAGQDVIANGVLVSRGSRHGRVTRTGARSSRWRRTSRSSRPVPSRRGRDSCDGIPNYVAVSKRSRQVRARRGGQDLADQTCAISPRWLSVLGPYPFSTTGRPGDRPPARLRPGEPDPADLPRGRGPTRAGGVHELAHQWFGDSVSVSGWRDVWLNEGFAQFLETYYVTEAVGGRSTQIWLQHLRRVRAGGGVLEALHRRPRPGRTFRRRRLRPRRDGPAGAAPPDRRPGVLDAAARPGSRSAPYGNGSVADFEALAAVGQRPGPHGVLRRLAARARCRRPRPRRTAV